MGEAPSPITALDGSGTKGWSKEELRASVAAYLEMQSLERANTHYTKKKYYSELAARFPPRAAKAFEYRMQNISYVLLLMGREWLPGFKPAKNVGAKVGSQLEALIAEVDGKKAAPVVAFEIEVREAIRKKELPQPEGSSAPKASITSVTQYQRDSSVKAWVLKQANGICECCDKRAPFNGADGLPYLEVHHVRMLAAKGSDTIGNAVAVCPNCHREFHHGEHAKELVEKVYKSIPRLKQE